MNVGELLTKSLQRCKLSVIDVATRDMALGMLDEVIQQRWHQKKWKFRKSSFTFNTTDNVEEYGLNKLSGDILPNTMLGSDPVRQIAFKPSTEFFRAHPYTIPQGNPYEYRDGEIWGVQTQPSASSQISVSSNLANYVTGTLNLVYGSRQIGIVGGAFTLDMLGRWMNAGTDTQDYKLSKFVSSGVFLLDRPYEGLTASLVSYKIGDVHQKVTFQGFDNNNSIVEEEVKLNGNTPVATTKFFAALNRVSKSDKTYGSITATSNAGIVTNSVLAPGETEADYQTIKMFPIPAKQEAINYESYGRHPYLYKDSDSPLFPSNTHPMLMLDLYIKIMNEFLEKDVNVETIKRRDQMLDDMIIKDNDLDDWKMIQETEYESGTRNLTNLPENYGGYSEFDGF